MRYKDFLDVARKFYDKADFIYDELIKKESENENILKEILLDIDPNLSISINHSCIDTDGDIRMDFDINGENHIIWFSPQSLLFYWNFGFDKCINNCTVLIQNNNLKIYLRKIRGDVLVRLDQFLLMNNIPFNPDPYYWSDEEEMFIKLFSEK